MFSFFLNLCCKVRVKKRKWSKEMSGSFVKSKTKRVCKIDSLQPGGRYRMVFNPPLRNSPVHKVVVAAVDDNEVILKDGRTIRFTPSFAEATFYESMQKRSSKRASKRSSSNNKSNKSSKRSSKRAAKKATRSKKTTKSDSTVQSAWWLANTAADADWTVVRSLRSRSPVLRKAFLP